MQHTWRKLAALLQPDCCCVSIQGLHPSKDPAFAAFEGESFTETFEGWVKRW